VKTNTFILVLWFCGGGLLQAKEPLPLLPGRESPSVIIPANIASANNRLPKRFTDFWTPTVQQVEKAEGAINEFLLAASKDQTETTNGWNKATYIQGRAKKYARQYFGAVVDGRQVIHCTGTSMAIAGGINGDWRYDFFFTYDLPGGNWGIDYDLKDGTCSRFWVESGY
jgi:hypothetical protein